LVGAEERAGVSRIFVVFRRRAVKTPGAGQFDLLEPPVVHHPEPEAVVILVVDQYLDALGPGPGQGLEVRKQACARAHSLELHGPAGSEARAPLAVNRHEASAPGPGGIIAGEWLHDVVGIESEDDDLGVCAHAAIIGAAGCRRAMGYGLSEQ
jgi:hypothetical protein